MPASAALRETRQRQRLKLPSAVNPVDAATGVATGPLTDTERGATTTIVAPTAITTHGRTTFFCEAPVSASCSVKTSPTAIITLATAGTRCLAELSSAAASVVERSCELAASLACRGD